MVEAGVVYSVSKAVSKLAQCFFFFQQRVSCAQGNKIQGSLNPPGMLWFVLPIIPGKQGLPWEGWGHTGPAAGNWGGREAGRGRKALGFLSPAPLGVTAGRARLHLVTVNPLLVIMGSEVLGFSLLLSSLRGLSGRRNVNDALLRGTQAPCLPVAI